MAGASLRGLISPKSLTRGITLCPPAVRSATEVRFLRRAHARPKWEHRRI